MSFFVEVPTAFVQGSVNEQTDEVSLTLSSVWRCIQMGKDLCHEGYHRAS